MNIFGIGIDIIEINRIENVLERTPRFLERNFTEKEIDYFKQKNFNILFIFSKTRKGRHTKGYPGNHLGGERNFC